MMSKFFNYKGYRFRPIGNIYNAFMKSKYITWEYTLDIDGYSHKDFYKKAKKEQCSCDIYEYGGKLYIPCDKTIVGITPNTPIKKCSMYDNWYKWSRYKNTHFDKEFIELLEKIKDTLLNLYPKMNAATTEDLFLANLFKQSFKNVVGFVWNF